MSKNVEKTNTGRSQIVGSSAIVEKRVWVASDGTEFVDRESAEKYEEILQNPYYKELKIKAEELKAKVERLQHDLLMERSKNPFRDVALNQRRNPQVPYYSGEPHDVPKI